MTTTEVPTAPEKQQHIYPGKFVVRQAVNNSDDLQQLVDLELLAFSDVYGQDVSESSREQVESKYANRLNTLSSWMRVLETPHDKKVIGMAIGCPTNYPVADLLQHDMTTTAALQKVYEPTGENLYVMNLATHPDAPKNLRFMLIGSLIAEGLKANTQRAYFESRLPGFDAWAKTQLGGVIPSNTDVRDELADVYWRETVDVGGRQRPLDKLLRIYVNLGAMPLQLVSEAWEVDKPSSSYGVLCSYDNPLPEKLRSSSIARKTAAIALQTVVGHPKIMRTLLEGRP